MPASWKTISSTGSTARARPSRKNPEKPALSRPPPSLCRRAPICPDRPPSYQYGNDGGEGDDAYPRPAAGRPHSGRSAGDRKSVVSGKRGYRTVKVGGRRLIKNQKAYHMGS